MPTDRSDAADRLALVSTWGNTRECVSVFVVTADVRVETGITASQAEADGSVHPGGAPQFLVAVPKAENPKCYLRDLFARGKIRLLATLPLAE